MPVVINEFEVVSEPTGAQTQATPPAAPEQRPAAIDVERLLADQRARATRVRAY